MKRAWKYLMEAPSPVFYTMLGANMVLYPLPGLFLAAGLGYARWRHKRVHPVAAAMSVKPIDHPVECFTGVPGEVIRPVRFADPSPLMPR